MQTNLLEYLEHTITEVPDKVAFSDGEHDISFASVYSYSRSIGTAIHHFGFYGKPVVVFMKRSPEAICAFFGVVYAGCFYVSLDSEMPAHRIKLILDNIQPEMVICDSTTIDSANDLGCPCVRQFSDLIAYPEDGEALADIRAKAIDCDPVYIVFTSGSTGIPKGVCACHRSVINYIESLTAVLKIDRSTVFGNQSPLYFDACLKEIYPTLKYGATTYLVPKSLFIQPVELIRFLNKRRINTICWVSSALTVVSGLGTLNEIQPEYLRTIAFGSEVFPIKQYRLWREVLPNARFINLYGPTEATGMSCYYEVDRNFELNETIPIGQPFNNTCIILITDDGREAHSDENGEIYVRGTPVTLGYFNDAERTAEAFVQNPLHNNYPDIVYRTGDIARRNSRGELEFVSRRDYQIKRMGHRIELGEIELLSDTLEGIASSVCVFDDSSKRLVLFYVGTVTPSELAVFTREKLPRYMIPNQIIKIEQMPYTPNGKINRKALKEGFISGKYQ